MAQTTVRLFASHPIARAEYQRLLERGTDLRLVGAEEACDIGVFDAEMYSLQAVLTLSRLQFPSMRPLLIAPSSTDEECLRWLFRGVCGLVPYERCAEELLLAIRRLAGRDFWFPDGVVEHWREIESVRSSSLQLHFTAREREVMELLLRRLSNKEIACTLGITERTVKFHVSNILGKLKMRSRQDLSVRWLNDWQPA